MTFKRRQDDEQNKFIDSGTDETIVRVGPIANGNSDFLLEVGKGNIPGYSFIFINGSNRLIGDSLATIRPDGNRYPFQLTAKTWDFVSTSANDAAAGTGAQLVLAELLDADYNLVVEIIVPNGTTPVSTVTEALRVNTFIVIQTGSSGYNEGDITLYSGSDQFSKIEATKSQSLQMVRTVPAGETWYPLSFQTTLGKDDDIKIDAIAGFEGGRRLYISEAYVFEANYTYYNPGRAQFPEKSDLEVVGSKNGGASDSKVTIFNEFLAKSNSVD